MTERKLNPLEPSESDRDRRGVCHTGIVTYSGRIITYPAEEAEKLVSETNSWHGPGDPGKWLCQAVFQEARVRLGAEAPDDVALDLASQVLGCRPVLVRHALEGIENYIRWHDGDPDYKILND